jgi:hypothetical protein
MKACANNVTVRQSCVAIFWSLEPSGLVEIRSTIRVSRGTRLFGQRTVSVDYSALAHDWGPKNQCRKSFIGNLIHSTIEHNRDKYVKTGLMERLHNVT